MKQWYVCTLSVCLSHWSLGKLSLNFQEILEDVVKILALIWKSLNLYWHSDLKLDACDITNAAFT